MSNKNNKEKLNKKTMKTTTLIILLLCAFNLNAQFAENRGVFLKEKTSIEPKKQIVCLELKGLIEIDGHTFKNNARKCPIIYTANLDGITIIDTCNNIEYQHKDCNKKDCDIIHLKKKETLHIGEQQYYWENSYDIILN